MLRQVVEPRLARVDHSATRQSSGADRRDRLVEVVRDPARVAARVERETRGLVGLQHLDAGGREQPEDRDDRERPEREQHGELAPADTDEEQDREERRRVDEGRAEVGLHEDQEDRAGAEPDDAQDRPPAHRRAGAVDDEARDREHEEHLAELGRLELDDAQVEPALRAADRLGSHEHDDHEHEGRAVDELPGPAPDVDRDQRHRDEADGADSDGETLPDDLVARVPRDVEARDPGDNPEAVADERSGSSHEDPVQAAQEREQRRLRATGGSAKPWAGVLGDLDHQSVSTTAGGAAVLTPKKLSNTLSAAGAAAAEP